MLINLQVCQCIVNLIICTFLSLKIWLTVVFVIFLCGYISELEVTASQNLLDASGSDSLGAEEKTLKACAQTSQPSEFNASSYQGDYK